MFDYQALLFPLFDLLRRRGLPLGSSEFLLAIQLAEQIQSKGGEQVAEDLKIICRLLWAKSREDQALYNQSFDKLVTPNLALPTREPNLLPEESWSEPEKRPTSEVAGTKRESTPSANSPAPNPKWKNADEMPFQLQPHLKPLSPDSSSTASDKPSSRYQLTPYLTEPFDKRAMTAAWRRLRKLRREGSARDLDVSATVKELGRTGILLKPIMQPRHRNQAKLLILLDQQGSMAPFTLLTDALLETIFRGGLLGHTALFYFHDAPQGLLFENPKLTLAQPIAEVLMEYAKDNSVLIISDAGAARGNYDSERVRQTQNFITLLSKYTYLYAWLNPLPPHRWEWSSAEEIAAFVPMFYPDYAGLNDAVNVLRGQPFSLGVR